MNKKLYLIPSITVTDAIMHSMLMQQSAGTDDNFAKGRSSYGDYEEEHPAKSDYDLFDDQLW